MRSSTASAAPAAQALGFANTVAQAYAEALQDSVIGVILHGSLVLDDYVPGRSDVDLLVVVRDPLSDGQLDALIAAVAALQPHAPGRVDLRVVTQRVAASPTLGPPMEAYIEIPRSGSEINVEELRHPGERDLVVEFSICRAHGRSLLGPPPAQLIGDVPARWVLDVGDAQLRDWLEIGDDPQYAELTVLTACRVWRFAEERRHCSKTAAAEWALQRDPQLHVVRDAVEQRRSGPPRELDPAQIHQLLVDVRARIANGRSNKPDGSFGPHR
jgi:Domain of unknown function (DUF4111)/Nucleotidyltransferase domain